MKIKLGKYTLHLIIEKEVPKPKTLADVAVEEMKKMDISQSKLTDELKEKVKAIARNNMIVMPDSTVRIVFNKGNDVIEETTVEDFYNKMIEIAEKA